MPPLISPMSFQSPRMSTPLTLTMKTRTLLRVDARRRGKLQTRGAEPHRRELHPRGAGAESPLRLICPPRRSPRPQRHHAPLPGAPTRTSAATTVAISARTCGLATGSFAAKRIVRRAGRTGETRKPAPTLPFLNAVIWRNKDSHHDPRHHHDFIATHPLISDLSAPLIW